MNVRQLFLMTVLVLSGALTACSTMHNADFSPGLEATLATLPKDVVVLIIGPGGKSWFVDRDGKPATPCHPPGFVKKDDRQIAITDKHTCTGLEKGYFVDTIHSDAVIRSFPNPHGCWYCYTRSNLGGTYQEICRPLGCESTGH